MRGVTKIAVASIAMLLIGGSAALAQPYGYGRYGGPAYEPTGDYYAPDGGHVVCGGRVDLAHIVNWTIDPATGMRITREEYQARYPWTNLANWTFDCATGLWTDHTQPPQYYQQTQNYPFQSDERYRGYDRDRERNYDRDRGREDNYDRDRERNYDRDRGRENNYDRD
jgi:hypothetical protein